MAWTTFGIGHPAFATLNQYVDAELTAAQSRRVSAHVMACRRCRGVTDGLNQLRTESRALPAPPVPPELLDRVLVRRAAGERMILPTADAAPGATFGVARIATVAAALIAIAGVLVVGGGPAVAAGADGSGELSFTPARPKAGDTLTVVYVAPEQLTHNEVLVLRSRIVTDALLEGEPRTRPLATRDTLRRTADGRFEGTLIFPPNAALALFAVEDSSAQHVDSRRRRYWRILAHDSSDRLTYAAALSSTGSASGQGWDRRYEAARELVDAFPDSLAAWRTLSFLENVVRGESDTAARTLHRKMFTRFESRANALRTPSADLLAGLMWYASSVDDTTRRRYWKQRLLQAAPNHPLAVQERAGDITMRHRAAFGSSREAERAAWKPAIAELDRLWNEVGNAHPTLATLGYQVSTWADEPEAILRWGKRYAENEQSPSTWLALASQEIQHASIRADGMRILRQLLQTTDPVYDSRRRLVQTVDEYRANAVALRGRALQELGEALLGEGLHEAAIDTLLLAAHDGWHPNRLRVLAEATLRAGDTLAALQSFALVAADPETAPAFADSALAKLGLSATNPRWTTARAAAPGTMRQRVMSTATRKRLRGDSVHLTDAAGRTHTFSEIARGRTTIVAFGLELGLASPVNIANMNRIAAKLAPNAQVITIPIRPRAGDAEARIRERGIRFGVYFDTANEMSRAFNAYGFPMYFVVDAAGDLRFAYSSPSQLLSQAGALASETVATSR